MDFRPFLSAIKEGLEHRLWRARTADIATVVGDVDNTAFTLTAQPLSRRWNMARGRWTDQRPLKNVRYIPMRDLRATSSDGSVGLHVHVLPAMIPQVDDVGLLVYLDSSISPLATAIATPDQKAAMPGKTAVMIMYGDI